MNIVVRRIFFHVVVGRFLVRIAPFDVFTRRQRQRCVEHRIQHIDKRDLRDDGFKEIRSHVGNRAHQHAAGAAALNHHAIFRRVLVVNQIFAASDEVCERIHLIHHAAGVAPGLAQFAAAANMRDNINDAAIKQRQS